MTHGRILVVEDDEGLREALTDTLAGAGYETLAADGAAAALETLANKPVALVVSDVRMDGMDGHALLREIKTRWTGVPVLMMTAYGTVASAVEAMRLGAADYLVKPFEAELLVAKVRQFLVTPAGDGELIACDARMREIVQLAERVAASDATVLLSGESGTGKEVLARFVHRRSRRAEGPFVAINCAAIPETMLEATLFGYEKGAFTGAIAATPGKFEQAQGGTLLLDEISEMPLALQAKLLRVLQEREVERLGGRKTVALDVRVLATTNRHLREEVAAGRFREDLYYRLNVFPLAIAPLRERPNDILPLARSLLARHASLGRRTCPAISAAAEARLVAHRWPGNVRELDNLMQRALILQPGPSIEAADLRFADGIEVMTAASLPHDPRLRPGAEARAAAQGSTGCGFDTPSIAADAESLNADLKGHEQRLILEALRAESGSRKDAAERLGISPRTLRYKLARMREAGIAI